MKKAIVSIFSLALTVTLIAQKPIFGPVVGEKVPMYCGSTGSSTADSTRLPILFQARIQGLTPGAKYKYFTRFISISDTASSTTTGAGIPIIIKKNGSFSTIASPDINTSGGHDTLVLDIGLGEYTGWFGAIYTSDSRFTPGKYVYPLIVFEEISAGANLTKYYLSSDSIKVLGFSTSFGSNNGTAIYGSSFVKAKSAVLLYDITSGITNRPVSITYSENEGISMSNTPIWYNAKVNATSGAWGTIIPNNFSNGIKRIESRDMGFDSIIFANIENDATFGTDSTINQKGGAKKPIVIKSDYAPLVKPEVEFVINTTNLTESNTTVNMLVRRKYGNADTTKISAFVAAGIATNGVDYNILTPFPLRFRPYGDVTDTIKVKVIDDLLTEPVENAAIRLNNPVNTRIGFQTTHSINITDNDIPLVSFAKKTVTVKENYGILKVKLKITSGATIPTSVRVLVKQKTDSTFIPSEFKLGSLKDTILQFPGGKVNDSFEFGIPIIDDIFSEDRSDTVILVIRGLTAPSKAGVDSLFTLIIEDNDAPPTYKFAKSAMTVKENAGSINLRINRIGGNLNQSDIVLTFDADPKNAQPGVDYTFSTQLLQFFSTDPDSFVLNVPILDDNLSEPKEDAVFIIRSAFNSQIGKPDTFKVTITDNDLPEYKIAKVTTAKLPSGVLDSLNTKCALRGVVYGVNLGPVGAPQGVTFTLMDNTGGIQVYKPSGGSKGYTVTEGDSIQVYGRIGQLNGMAQITQLDTILKLGSGRTLKTPLVGAGLNETTESNLVKYSLVKLKNPSLWPTSAMAPNTTMILKVQTQSDSFDLLIDSETDIDGKAAPSGFMHVTGLGGQNDNSTPFTSNYYLAPRKYADIQNLIVPVFSFRTDTSRGVEKNTIDSTEGFVLQCANLTNAQQINLVIKGGTAKKDDDYQSNTSRLFILYPTAPDVVVKTKLNDDILVEGVAPETIIWAIRDNSWGTLIGPDSIHVVNIFDGESVSIEMVQLAAKTKLYPNPSVANSEISVSSEAVISSIKIIDINGKVVKEVSGINDSFTKLDLEGLSKGLYTVSIMTDKGKIVKQLSIL